ncbi:MAG: B12-binding domain-containing radical SAM protein [Pontiellaceae bacterium]|nr:B12-binding domain-containing radical SAM protein [Pontiellaceae bacterium]
MNPHENPAAVLDQVAELTRGSDLIGISLTSNYVDHAICITQHLRRSSNAPIIWGGIHPTLRPEECLKHADLVCIGEGEDALIELVQKKAKGGDCTGVRNIWYKQNGEVVRTPLRPLPIDLDAYPYPDYDLDAEYVLHKGTLQPMTRQLLYEFLEHITYEEGVSYRAIMSRTCRNRCAYCASSALGKLYGKEWRVRRRSVAHFIGELNQAVARFPEIQRVVIEDEFFLDDDELIRDFCSAYKKEVGLPFVVTGMFPSIISAERIRLLVDAGMYRAGVGIQTGSERVMQKVFQRPCTQEQIVNVFAILNAFKDRFKPTYQYIVDNPWETEADQLETLRQLLIIPKPCILEFFSLTLFPGTRLSERAIEEGLITDEHSQVYRKDYHFTTSSYINELYCLFQKQQVPRWAIRLLMTAPLRRLGWVRFPVAASKIFYVLAIPRKILKRIQRKTGRGSGRSLAGWGFAGKDDASCPVAEKESGGRHGSPKG